MRRVLALLLATALPAYAERAPLSAEIGANGLAATEARLAALPAPTAEQGFALGGIRFLLGIEGALQLRWQTGLVSFGPELPVLRLPIPPNPNPRPFAPDDIVTLLTGLETRMEGARTALAVTEGQDFGLEIALSDLWFDIDGNGARSDGESVSEVAGLALAGAARGGFAAPADPVIRFDTADADWLEAYTHFLSAFANLALAFDPAAAVARVQTATAGMKALWGTTPPPNALDMMLGHHVDRAAIILLALQSKPDAARAGAARDHLLSMIAANGRFWRAVEAETDDAAEWVPNDRQTSALGIPMPEGTGARWQAVLNDAEGVLTGRLLVPHWRMGAEGGIDVSAVFAAAPPVDVITWAQGEGLLPYARKGPRVSAQSWRDFERLVQGDALLFALFLN